MAEKRFEREEWDRVWNFVRGLEAKIKGLDNNAQPTVPVYDPTHFPLNAVEGQLALGTDGSEYKYQDGAWSPIGGGTVSGGSGAIEWQDLGGPIDIHIPAIKFDTWPQSGTYLMLQATGTYPGSSNAILLESLAAGGSVNINATGFIQIAAPSIQFGPNVMSIGTGGVGIDSGQVGIGLPAYDGNQGRFFINGPTGTPIIYVKASTAAGSNDGAFEVWSAGSLPYHPIFRVTQDGTYHIMAGATWVDDLT